VLAELLPQYSRNRLQTWIREGRVSLNGQPVQEPKHKLLGGEFLNLEEVQDEKLAAETPEDIPFPVVYEDEAILIINKPAGLVVHPGSGNWSGTLLNALLHHTPQLAQVPRAGIVHRLDKDTSGLMVVAKTLEAQTDLVRQLQARTVKREYRALLVGYLNRNGTVDAPIGRDPHNRVRMSVNAGGSGKEARTRYRVIERFSAATLLECSLDTGRTHQIRVHMQSLGHPLVGDPVYRAGRPRTQASGEDAQAAIADFPRQALHAARLAFIHPDSGAAMAFESPLPADFAALLAALRAPAQP